ncbi:hypothetical protein [uncultured Gimesia sp.]|uniref:hypothetical protein n=1 Tax=uncultured Gimesia sp. TaxID=1678688 RepID=UPI002628E471|nr:hypothetical protein [uncultured Gimesia sp.]
MLLTNWLGTLTSHIKRRPLFRSRDRRDIRRRWNAAVDNQISTTETLEDRTLLTPQIASFILPTVVNGANSFTIDVSYQDDLNIPIVDGFANPNALTVTGPGGALNVVIATPISPSGGPSVTTRYTVIPPGGSWDHSDNGSYSVTLLANNLRNAINQFNVESTFGGFNVNLAAPPNTAPTITGTTAPNVGAGEIGDTSYSFTVEYSDDSAIDVSTIDVNDVTVTGPGGALMVASAVEVSGVDGTPKTATYTITPPGGNWDIADNGVYMIALNGSEVGDDGGPQLFVAADPGLTTFTVDLPTVVSQGVFIPPNPYNSNGSL